MNTWKVQDLGTHLVLVAADFRLAQMCKETMVFELCFPLDDDDEAHAKMMLTHEMLLTLAEEILSVGEAAILYGANVDREVRERWRKLSARVADLRAAEGGTL